MQTTITFQAWAAAVVARYPRALIALDRTGELPAGSWVAVRTVAAIGRIVEDSLLGWFNPVDGDAALYLPGPEFDMQEWRTDATHTPFQQWACMAVVHHPRALLALDRDGGNADGSWVAVRTKRDISDRETEDGLYGGFAPACGSHYVFALDGRRVM